MVDDAGDDLDRLLGDLLVLLVLGRDLLVRERLAALLAGERPRACGPTRRAGRRPRGRRSPGIGNSGPRPGPGRIGQRLRVEEVRPPWSPDRAQNRASQASGNSNGLNGSAPGAESRPGRRRRVGRPRRPTVTRRGPTDSHGWGPSLSGRSSQGLVGRLCRPSPNRPAQPALTTDDSIHQWSGCRTAQHGIRLPGWSLYMPTWPTVSPSASLRSLRCS